MLTHGITLTLVQQSYSDFLNGNKSFVFLVLALNFYLFGYCFVVAMIASSSLRIKWKAYERSLQIFLVIKLFQIK